MPQWNGKWMGGRTYLGKDGRTIFWLDRSWNGKRYGIALDVGSRREAEAELALFLRDPSIYVERREARRKIEEGKVVLSEGLIDQFEAHLRKLGREERHVRGCRHYIDWWLEKLGKVDLRKVGLVDLRRCLKGVETAKRNRIASWKIFCSYLREELAILPRGEDSSLDLHAPPSKPEKLTREKGYTIERIEKFYSALSAWHSERPGWELKTPDVQSVRDCLLLHAKTGMHQTEVMRLAAGDGKIAELEDEVEIAGTITFVHKSGYVHTVSVDLQTVRAAQRLQKRGSAPSDSYIRKVIDRTAKVSKLEGVRLGELRHSFTTWGRTMGELVRPKGRGVSVEEVAAVLGHTTTRTTRLHYDGTKVPPMVKVPIKLFHPEDPVEPTTTGLKLVANYGG
jgi:integrase